MLRGINQWAFPAGMPVAEAMGVARRVGFESFEVCLGDDGPTPITLTEAEAVAIRCEADRLGLALPSVATIMAWKYPLTANEPEVRAKGAEVVETMLRAAKWLGADTMLLVPGVVSPEVSYDAALERALKGIRALAPLAESLGVCIGVENVWNKFLLSPVEMRDFIDACESPMVGAYVDTGNVMAYGYPEQYLRILGRRVRKIHAKDFRVSAGNMDGFVMLMEGDVNWPAVMSALREIGYDGPLTAEYGPYKHGAETMLRHACASLETIIGMA